MQDANSIPLICTNVHCTSVVYARVSGELGFPGGWVVKNPPAMQETQETQVWSLGWEDPLEEGMKTHSSILGWRILWTEEPGRLQSTGPHSVRHNWSDLAHTHGLSSFYTEEITEETSKLSRLTLFTSGQILLFEPSHSDFRGYTSNSCATGLRTNGITNHLEGLLPTPLRPPNGNLGICISNKLGKVMEF